MDVRSVAKILIVYQSQEVLIELKQLEVLWLYCLLSRHPNRKKANQAHLSLV